MSKIFLILFLLTIPSCKPAYAGIDTSKLAMAIWSAEGGLSASKPYGIMKDY